MDIDELSGIVRGNSKTLQAALNEMAELRQILNGTLRGVQALSDTKVEDLATLGRVETRLDSLEEDTGDIKALVQEIRNKLEAEGL